MIEAETGILEDTINPKLFFQHFAQNYLVHNAENAFAWAAKCIKFGHLLPESTKMALGFYWIKNIYL